MNWLVLGRKAYGHMTKLQRQASKCTFGTTTPCMTFWPMGYSVPGVFTGSFPLDHPFRQDIKNFMKSVIVKDPPP
jgi:hypothetical protein